MTFLLTAFLFVLGLSIGSFLNVIIDRVANADNPFKGHSHCDHCKKRLAWYDLIPVVSWLTLGGRCRYCGGKLSPYYPLIEVVTGLAFVLVAIIVPLLDLGYWWVITSALIVIFFTDLKYGIIPDIVVFPGIFLGLIKIVLTGVLAGQFEWGGIIAGILAMVFFYFLRLFTRGRGMGLGDVKLVLLMGLILGHPGLWIALYFAFLTGGIAGAILILLRKKKLQQSVPFGPFLVTGTVLTLILAKPLVKLWNTFLSW